MSWSVRLSDWVSLSIPASDTETLRVSERRERVVSSGAGVELLSKLSLPGGWAGARLTTPC